MVPIVRQSVSRDGIEIVKLGGDTWSLTRDQFLAMRQAQSLIKCIADVKASLAAFLEVDPADINRKLLFNAQNTGEMSLDIANDE